MKRTIFIIVMMALVLAAGVTETVLSSGLFKDLNARLRELDAEIEAHVADVSTEKALGLIDGAIERWRSGRELALLLGNHTVMRSLDEKLVSLKSWIETGGYEDSKALCESAMALTEDLIDETYPILSNLL